MLIQKNLNFFFIAFLVSLVFWWGINLTQEKLENFLFGQIMAVNPELLTAQITWEKKLEKLKPIRNRQIDDLEITAKAATSVFIDREGSEKTLFEKNADRSLPIASLTKLMTANLVLENYDLSQEKTRELLFLLLIKSDNEAAMELAKIISQESFVELMNLEAKRLGMENSYFVNPSGLDPKKSVDLINYSTPKDLVKLAKYITLEKPLIWEISIIPEYKNATNTNALLKEIPEIVGGKTGETPLAGKCLLLVIKAPKNKGWIVNVILNSENHFEEMKKLINWTKYAYKW